MRVFRFLVAVAVVVALPGLSYAQPKAGASLTTSANRSKLALARTFIAQSQRESISRDLYKKQLRLSMTFCIGKPCQSDLEKAIDHAADDATRALMEKTAELYARTFTAADLKALIAFYETPEGRHISEALRSAEAEHAEMQHEFSLQIFSSVNREFCPKHREICLRQPRR